MKNGKYIAIGCIGISALIALCALPIALFIARTSNDINYSDEKLNKIAISAEPLISALNDYKIKNGKYPAKLTDINNEKDDLIKNSCWRYIPSENGMSPHNFCLLMPLDREEYIYFRSEDNSWYLNLGPSTKKEKKLELKK